MKMKLIDYEECEICENEIESITHLFISCEQLVEFHQHIQEKIEILSFQTLFSCLLIYIGIHKNIQHNVLKYMKIV
jgi:hypothetical protein